MVRRLRQLIAHLRHEGARERIDREGVGRENLAIEIGVTAEDSPVLGDVTGDGRSRNPARAARRRGLSADRSASSPGVRALVLSVRKMAAVNNRRSLNKSHLVPISKVRFSSGSSNAVAAVSGVSETAPSAEGLNDVP